MKMVEAWPSEFRLRDKGHVLSVSFDDGCSFNLPAEYLRVESPSAEVQGHGPGQEVLVHGKRMVRITGLEPVGHYAMRILFDDGHSTGLFTWTYLQELGRDQEKRWLAYLQRLDEAGQGRG